jgi:peptidyl-tRNA hydrolase
MKREKSLKNSFVKMCLLFTLVIFFNATYAQLKSNSKVFLTYAETPNEVNVNGEDAKAMLKDYLIGKTTIQVAETKEDSEFTLQLCLYEKNMGDRSAKFILIDNKSSTIILETKWVRGTMNAFYGYSGSRHAIGRLVKDQLIDAFPSIEKND